MNITEELLDIIPLKYTTTGQNIFDAVFSLLEQEGFPIDRLISVTTDGAKSLTGVNRGFVTLLNKALKEKFTNKGIL